MKLAALLLIAATVSVHAQDLDFKSIPFGASQEQAREAVIPLGATTWTCRPITDGMPAIRCRVEGMTYANVPTKYVAMTFYEDKLEDVFVEFSSEGFQDAADALARRYGKPTSSKRSKVQTNAGGVFDQTEISWSVKGGHKVVARRYADTLDTSTVNLLSVAGLRALKQGVSRKPDI
jgi:hypothetical protein